MPWRTKIMDALPIVKMDLLDDVDEAKLKNVFKKLSGLLRQVGLIESPLMHRN